MKRRSPPTGCIHVHTGPGTVVPLTATASGCLCGGAPEGLSLNTVKSISERGGRKREAGGARGVRGGPKRRRCHPIRVYQCSMALLWEGTREQRRRQTDGAQGGVHAALLYPELTRHTPSSHRTSEKHLTCQSDRLQRRFAFVRGGRATHNRSSAAFAGVAGFCVHHCPAGAQLRDVSLLGECGMWVDSCCCVRSLPCTGLRCQVLAGAWGCGRIRAVGLI